MFDGIGENISLALAVFPSVLLRTKHYRLRAMHPVNPIDYFIQSLHLLELLCIDVKEILLNWTVWAYSHDDNTGFLVLVALLVYLLEDFIGRFDNGNAGAGGCEKSLLLEVPILWQILPEIIGIQEYTDDGGNCILHPQLLSTPGSIVRDMGTQCFYVCNHAIEGTTGTDGFLFRQLFVWHNVLTIQLLPGSDDVDVIECQSYPILVMLGEVQGSLTAKSL